MNDTVYRQDTIDAVIEIPSGMSVCLNIDECHGMKWMQERVVKTIENLPSAQSDLIYCKDCEYLDIQGTYAECGKGILGIVNRDDFCSRAERRTDGTD